MKIFPNDSSALHPPFSSSTQEPHKVVEPSYLRDIYTWCYLTPRNVSWLDKQFVVSAILWGNAHRLMTAAVAEFKPGSKVFQAASVYGKLLPMLAKRVGEQGRLDVVDVAPLQVNNAKSKLQGLENASVRRADLAEEPIAKAAYDGVSCFFLLHEVPQDVRSKIVDNLLQAVKPGGKIVFVDYHRYAWWHPLRFIMAGVFKWLEPYAPSLLKQDITKISAQGPAFTWTKRTKFGSLYQIVIGTRN
jgi:SAM-dependent methyltransferase